MFAYDWSKLAKQAICSTCSGSAHQNIPSHCIQWQTKASDQHHARKQNPRDSQMSAGFPQEQRVPCLHKNGSIWYGIMQIRTFLYLLPSLQQNWDPSHLRPRVRQTQSLILLVEGPSVPGPLHSVLQKTFVLGYWNGFPEGWEIQTPRQWCCSFRRKAAKVWLWYISPVWFCYLYEFTFSELVR